MRHRLTTGTVEGRGKGATSRARNSSVIPRAEERTGEAPGSFRPRIRVPGWGSGKKLGPLWSAKALDAGLRGTRGGARQEPWASDPRCARLCARSPDRPASRGAHWRPQQRERLCENGFWPRLPVEDQGAWTAGLAGSGCGWKSRLVLSCASGLLFSSPSFFLTLSSLRGFSSSWLFRGRGWSSSGCACSVHGLSRSGARLRTQRAVTPEARAAPARGRGRGSRERAGLPVERTRCLRRVARNP